MAKFGGSSLASSNQLQKVIDIIRGDSKRRAVVVSAPGKRFADDRKVTDLLIDYANVVLKKANPVATGHCRRLPYAYLSVFHTGDTWVDP